MTRWRFGLKGATREFRVDGGVADIATDTHIYEVDRLAKWHEGIGQVIHYRDESGQGVLVLILPDGYSDWVRLERLERKRCKPYKIKLIVLVCIFFVSCVFPVIFTEILSLAMVVFLAVTSE